MDGSNILISLIGAVVAVAVAILAPWFLAGRTNKNVMAVKRMDWDRADLLEHRLIARQDEVARLLKENTATATADANEIKSQVKTVHALVNSRLTTEMQGGLDTMKLLLAALMEIADLKTQLGHPTMPDSGDLIASYRHRIIAMETAVAAQVVAAST